VLGILKDFAIEDKIGYFTLDNATNNDTCMQNLGLELNFDPKFRRLRCAGHMINLMAKQVLFGKDADVFDLEAASLGAASFEKDLDLWRREGPIGKLHRIINWIYKSSQRKTRFHMAQEAVGTKKGKTLELVRDVKPRWNSTNDMIKRAMQLKQGLNYFIDKEGLEERAGVGDADARYIVQNRLSEESGRFWKNTSTFLILWRMPPKSSKVRQVSTRPGSRNKASLQTSSWLSNIF
jgi:hypothetical protein